jgi:hypothetical protein
MNQQMRSVVTARCMFALGTWLGMWLGGCGDDAGPGRGHAADDAGRAPGDSGTRAEQDAGVAPSKPEYLVSELLADAGDGWQSLIQAHWVMPANSESYRCARITLPKDIIVHEFHSLSPLGTHHDSVSLVNGSNVPDGVSACDGATNGQSGLFAGGVGGTDYALPKGVAMRLRAGQQILLNLHLFNPSENPLEGDSGMLVRLLPEKDAEHFAEGVLAGTIDLDIEPGRNVVQSGRCTMLQDTTIIAVGPHMHMHGVHLKAVAESSIDGTVTLSDEDYSFDSQVMYPVGAVRLKAGDFVSIDCTYDNMSDRALHFGNSSLDEMCFAELLRYPVSDTPMFLCAN